MPLDKNNKNESYLLGRYMAVVELANGKILTASQVHNLLQNPARMLPRIDRNPMKLSDMREDIIALLDGETWKDGALTAVEASRYWIGYYHQKAALPMITTDVVHHYPDRVEPKENNVIDELKK